MLLFSAEILCILVIAIVPPSGSSFAVTFPRASSTCIIFIYCDISPCVVYTKMSLCHCTIFKCIFTVLVYVTVFPFCHSHIWIVPICSFSLSIIDCRICFNLTCWIIYRNFFCRLCRIWLFHWFVLILVLLCFRCCKQKSHSYDKQVFQHICLLLYK